MELKVTLTLSDRLFALLEDKLPNLGRRFQRAVKKEVGSQLDKTSNVTIEVMPGTSETLSAPDAATEPEAVAIVVEAEPVAAVAEREAPAPAAVTEAAAKAEASAREKARNLGVEIRQIIHRTRQRFEGEDYKENTGSEYYKKYHRACSEVLKQIARALGYAKPSLIDDPSKVDQFAAECDALIIGEDGNITSPRTILNS